MEMTRGFESLDNCRPEPRRNIGFVGQMNDGGTPDGRLALWRIGNDILWPRCAERGRYRGSVDWNLPNFHVRG